MSVRVMSWVWEHSASSGVDRLVLLAIADSANDHGREAWPSVSKLMEKTNLSRRTVQRAIGALIELGELTVKANAGRNGVNVYALPMKGRHVDAGRQVDTGGVTETPRQDDAASDTTQGGVRNGTEGRQADAQTVLDPSLNHPSSRSAAADPTNVRQDVERLCNQLADALHENGMAKRPTITKAWRDECRRLIDLDKRTEEQVSKAIVWCQDDAFWRGNILSMPKLREKYEQMRLQAQRPAQPVRAVRSGTTSQGSWQE